MTFGSSSDSRLNTTVQWFSRSQFQWLRLSYTSCLVGGSLAIAGLPQPSQAQDLLLPQNSRQFTQVATPQCTNFQAEQQLLEKKLRGVEKQIKATEKSIREFREENQVVDLVAEAKGSIEIINKLNLEITNATPQLATEKSRIAALQSSWGTKLTRGNLVGWQKSNVPESVVLDYLKAEHQKVMVEQKISALLYIQSAYRERANRLPQLEEIQGGLNRQREVSAATHKTLRTKLDELQIAEMESKFSDAPRSQVFLQQQLVVAETKVRSAERQIRDFKERNQVVDLASEAVRSIQTINTINTEIMNLTAQLAAEKSRMSKLQTTLGTQKIEQNLINLKKSNLGAVIVNDYLKAKEQKASLEQRISSLLYVSAAYRERANRFPEFEQTQRELNRQLEVSSATYKALYARAQDPTPQSRKIPACGKSIVWRRSMDKIKAV
jgi:capsule polysaccharide export protein KpsE/RkpR